MRHGRGDGGKEMAWSGDGGGKGVDLYGQARKVLSLRSPFDVEEGVPLRDPMLPAGIAAFYERHADGRRKHNKTSEDLGEKPPTAPLSAVSIWESVEVYFRPLTLEDIDKVMPAAPRADDPSLLMPAPGVLSVQVYKDASFDAATAENSSNDAVGTENLITEKQNIEIQQLEKDGSAAEQQESPQEQQPIVANEPETSGWESLVKEEDDSLSMNWLLGAKDRFVLTTDRPNKKRKLLGKDAGLDCLLLLPLQDGEICSKCDMCCSGDSPVVSNNLLHCHACGALVHQKCYGIHVVPDGPWLCAWCKHLESPMGSSRKDVGDGRPMPCSLCPKAGGALKPLEKGSSRTRDGNNLRFAHLFCGIWMPEVYVEDVRQMEPLLNVGVAHEARKKLVCNICKVKHGACVRCSHGTCRASFHPMCARESRYRMEIWGKFKGDNVEMRAYCSKHSTVKDAANLANSGSNSISGSDSFDAKSSDEMKNMPKLKISCKNTDEILAEESAICHSNISVDTHCSTEQNSVTNAVQSRAVLDADEAVDDAKLTQNSQYLSLVLRKLIDRGKITIGDIASGVGISSESLKVALVGETTTFSPGLKSKIVNWLQSAAHMPIVLTKRIKCNPAVLPDGNEVKVDCSDGADTSATCTTSDNEGNDLSTRNSTLVKYSSRKREGNAGTLKNNITPDMPGAAEVVSNGHGSIVSETGDGRSSVTEDKTRCTNGKLYSVCSVDHVDQHEEQNEQGVALNFDSIPCSAHNSKGTSPKGKFGGSSKTELKIEPLEPAQQDFPDACTKDNAVPNDVGNVSPADDNILSSMPALNVAGSTQVSQMHPLVRRKLSLVSDQWYFQKNLKEIAVCSSYCLNPEQNPDISLQDQISKSKYMAELELPVDEVEGELAYLQCRLLETSMHFKRNCEDLMLKVVQNLSSELSTFNRRKWDLIIVSQYLRDLKEAKKRGRKERRTREAQAELAAAAAEIVSSSRNSSLRKDAIDEARSAHQTTTGSDPGPVKVGQTCTTKSRLKDSSRFKISQDKHSLIFQSPYSSKENALYCDICMRTETLLNRIFICSSCKVSVHLDCYRSLANPISSWKCELCEELSLQSASSSDPSDSMHRNLGMTKCSLCGGTTGAFRRTAEGKWIHALCAEWLLESTFSRGQESLIEGMDALLNEKSVSCCICHDSFGACVKCSYGDCQSTFHPTCARGSGFYMNTKFVSGKLQHKAYCHKHSSQQREVDNLQYGVVDFKNMKQIRVELEKLRLLCERIIRREKLKRDLVQCSHDILAAKKDAAAFSVLMRGSLFRAGGISDLMTASLNNRTYSGTTQNSDDATVDSSASGRHTVRFSLHSRDVERNTEESSTSQVSLKRKLTDTQQQAGKQLPPKPRATPASHDNTEDEGKKTKEKKMRETFRKELVMTSDQASVQNQRLPKGFFYVPVGRIPKDKPQNGDSEPCDLPEPGG